MNDATSSPSPRGTASTAHWIAAVRARESERPDALFVDRFAAALAGDVGRKVLAASEAASGGENAYLPIRIRFFDDVLVEAVANSDQVVLLGAGFDTRAFRLPRVRDVRWFEIDAAEVLEEKERVLDELGATDPSARTVVVADLADDWVPALLRSGFVPGRRTAWIAEGLFFYLSPDAVGRLLRDTRRLSGRGSCLGADVSGSGLLGLPMMERTLRARTAQGLPPPFTTDDPRALCTGAGWMHVELADLGQLAAAYRRPLESPAWARDPTLAANLRTHLFVARA